jgi:ribosomal protein S17E
MGRIKSKMIKRAARQLIEKDTRFINQFENNKKVLAESMPSKPIRNKIAGYIARLKKMEQNKKVPTVKVVQEEEVPQYMQY